MRQNGLLPHCSWEIDRHGKRRMHFRWRKVSRSITDTPGEAKQQARQQQNDLAAQRAALEAKNAVLENRIEKLENLLALSTRFN
jgi:hypothetical protein